MKFTINYKTFKNITERASAVCAKATSIPVFSCVELVADAENETVTVKAGNLRSFAEIRTNEVSVIESGNGFIDLPFLKRLYKITGEITVSTEGNNIVFNNGKKQSAIYSQNLEPIDFPKVEKVKPAFSVDKAEILDTFSRLSCCLCTNEAKPIHTGFKFGNEVGENYISSLDGYKAMRRTVDWGFRKNLDMVIPSIVAKELPKVSNNKIDETIIVDSNDTHVWFKGRDFTYIIRLLEGNFLDTAKFFSDAEKKAVSFEVAAKEMATIGKEYKEICGFKLPMTFCFTNGKIISVGMNDSYITSDVLNADNKVGIPDNMVWGVNPNHVAEVFGSFGKSDVQIYTDGTRIDLWVICGDDGYKALILPVRLKDTTSVSALSFAQSA